MKTNRSDGRHVASAQHCACLVVAALGFGLQSHDIKQALVERAAQLDIEQRYAGLLALRVNDRPLPQRQRSIGEHQRQAALRGGRSPH